MSKNFIEFFLNKNSLIEKLKRGSVVICRILGINKKFVILDSNLKSESYLHLLEFYDYKNNINIKIGDFIETILIKIDNGFGYTVVSRSLFLRFYLWRFVRFIFEKKINIKCDFLNKLKNGVYLNFKGLKCFLPFKNIDKNLFLKLDHDLNKNLIYRIVSYSFKKKTIILSRKIVFNKFLNLKKKYFFINLKVGIFLKGIIKNINNNGIFISLGYVDGFIPLINIKKTFKKHPNEFLSVNQSVLIKILKKVNIKNILILKLIYFKNNFENYKLNLKYGFKKFLRVKILSNNFIKLVFENNTFAYIKKIDFKNQNIFSKFLKKLKINYFIEILIKKNIENKIFFKLIRILKFINPSLAQ